MKAWIARDTEGYCQIFCNKPKLVEDKYEENGSIRHIKYWDDGECPILEMTFDKGLYPGITFNNSPQLVNINESEFLFMLRQKRDQIIESYKSRAQDGLISVFSPELAMDQGSIYVLNHIISLLEVET